MVGQKYAPIRNKWPASLKSTRSAGGSYDFLGFSELLIKMDTMKNRENSSKMRILELHTNFTQMCELLGHGGMAPRHTSLANSQKSPNILEFLGFLHVSLPHALSQSLPLTCLSHVSSLSTCYSAAPSRLRRTSWRGEQFIQNSPGLGFLDQQ